MATVMPLPQHDCHAPVRECPIMRTCPCCGRLCGTERSRLRHQTACAATISVEAAEAQHLHRVLFHQPGRARRNTRQG